MKRKYAFVLSVLVGLTSNAWAQSEFVVPEVGKKMPDLVFKNVRGHTKKTVSVHDFKGKWLFLDFWGLTCGACLQSFPKVNEIQSEFRNDLQYILIGNNGGLFNRGIQKVYERAAKIRNFDLAITYDSALFVKLDISTIPHIYIVDPKGILRFITSGQNMTKERVRELVNGNEVAFYPKEMETSAFGQETLINNQLPAEKVLYISTLTEWNGEAPNPGNDIDVFHNFPEDVKNRGWCASMVPLFELYNYAYLGRASWFFHDNEFYGKIYAHPILEINDSSLFQFDFSDSVGKCTYNYLLKSQPEKLTPEFIMREMQNSLSAAFGYKVSIDEREMPVWKLIANGRASVDLKAKGGKPFFSGGNSVAGFTVRNYTVKNFLSLVTANFQNDDRIAFVDETGITNSIDFQIDTDMTDYESVRKKLREHGLDLVKRSTRMKVVVIRD
jgi:thiol-disulfide isomerase/thioredoxin